MTDQRHPAPDSGSGAGDESSPPPAPRWVKAFGIVAIVLVLLFVIRHLAGGGFHRHILP